MSVESGAVLGAASSDGGDPGLALGLRREPGWRGWIRPLIGLGLVLIGIALWILPVLPGFVLALVGAPMLLSLWPRRRARVQRRIVGWVERVGFDTARIDRRERRRRELAERQSRASE